MLISVIVVTYNSAKFVIQTLDSIFRQTYPEIELIISDDCSTDNTPDICKQWIESHQGRFANVQFISTPTNGGICKNYNYSLSFANGEYIKYIAGDDMLTDNCIERFVANIQPDTFLYTCIAGHLDNKTGTITYHKTRLPDSSASKQAKIMLKTRYGINGPTIFVHRNILLRLGGFEEKYPMIEDWPIAIRFLTAGYRIGIIDEPLVFWRIYGDSISHSNHSFADDLSRAQYDYAMRYCLQYGLPCHKYNYWLNHWLINNSKKSTTYSILGYILRIFDIINTIDHLIPIDKTPYQIIIPAS